MLIHPVTTPADATASLTRATSAIDAVTKLMNSGGAELPVDPAWGPLFEDSVASDIAIGASYFMASSVRNDAVIGVWLNTRSHDASDIGDEMFNAAAAGDSMEDHTDWVERLTSIQTDLVEAVRLLSERV